MLAKAQRLTQQEFTHVFQNGKRFTTPVFLFVYIKRTDEKTAFAVSVPKKIARKAHERTALRRRIYAGIAPTMAYAPSVSVVVIAREAIQTHPLHEIPIITTDAINTFYEAIFS